MTQGEYNDLIQSWAHQRGWQDTASKALGDDRLLDWLFTSMLGEDELPARHAAEVIRLVSDKNKNVILPYVGGCLKKLETECPDGVRRCIFRMLQHTDIPEEHQSTALELAFRDLRDYSQPIAIRVFAMSTVANIAESYPELLQELIAEITPNLSEQSAGFRNRAMKIINGTWKP